jgi:hypothetical protein
MNEKVIFFNGFLKGLKHDPGDLSLVESECPVVGPADQVVGVDVLDDAKRTAHRVYFARTPPKLPEVL